MSFVVIANTVLVVVLIYLGVCTVYYFIQEKFIFVPVHTDEFKRRELKHEFEELLIDTPNNGIIHAYLLKAKNARGLVFYLHGNTGNMKRWKYMADDLCKLGFDVFVMDYRGYGDSHGKRSEAIMHRDVEFCYDHIRERYKLPVIIYGRSLGCAFATRLAARRSADKLVLETPFNNMIDTAHSHMPFLPVRFLLKYRFRSDIYIKQVNCPIHILHGTRDLMVPYSLALRLFNIAHASGRDVRMTTIKGGRHGNLIKFKQFNQKLNQFLLE